tara:strand:- start:624 stop:1304 length:681 start_codon:yes stop_codon:yes gene_type:complete
MTQDLKKHSYTIPCSSGFRDAVSDLAVRRRVNVGDLARSVLLVVPENVIREYPDPGEPEPDDRETVILKSGAAKGRPWRRKPRLQVRMSPGFEVEFMRRALAIALALENGETQVLLADPNDLRAQEEVVEEEPMATGREVVDPEELVRLRTIVSVLSFDPLDDGVRSREDALYVLGFPPGRLPDSETLRARFRMLATIHHPDSPHGDHRRMSQLNSAMDILKRGAF